MMDGSCSDVRNRMIDRANGVLPDAEWRQVVLHAESCKECGRFMTELQRQDKMLSGWAVSTEPELQAGLAEAVRSLRACGRPAGRAFRTAAPLRYLRQAAAAMILVGLGFLAGSFASNGRRAGETQPVATALSTEARAQLIEDVLGLARAEIEQCDARTRRQLTEEFAGSLEKATKDLSAAMDRDRKWLMTTLTVLEGKRNEERDSLYRDIAKLAHMTENEFIRTKQYFDQAKSSIESRRRPNMAPGDPAQGSEL